MRRFHHVLAAACSLALAGEVSAAVITFEGYAPPGGLVNVNPLAPYTEAGFTFAPTNGSSAVFDSASTGGSTGNGTDIFGFQGNTNPITLTLTAGSGGPFNLTSLDIGRLPFGAPSVTHTITGTPAGGGSPLVATFSGIVNPTSITLNWTNLSSVTFTGSSAVWIDNLNATQVVPEPGTIVTLGLLGVVCAGYVRRRMKTASAA